MHIMGCMLPKVLCFYIPPPNGMGFPPELVKEKKERTTEEVMWQLLPEILNFSSCQT